VAEIDPAMEGALTEARAQASKLFSTLDKLNEKLGAFELSLAGLKLGVALSVPLDPKHPNKKTLEFAKSGDLWRLLIVEGDTEVPAVNATRYERMAAIKQLKALVLTAPEVLDAEVRRVEEAIKTVEEFIEAVRAVVAKEG
jgi:hypothetical protein